jgi:heme oxygenase
MVIAPGQKNLSHPWPDSPGPGSGSGALARLTATGRARHWKQFVEALDGLDLDAAAEARMQQAACAAFRRFDQVIRDAFALPA